jgi:hypothetical protein
LLALFLFLVFLPGRGMFDAGQRASKSAGREQAERGTPGRPGSEEPGKLIEATVVHDWLLPHAVR